MVQQKQNIALGQQTFGAKGADFVEIQLFRSAAWTY